MVALSLDKLGTVYAGSTEPVDPDRARAYAEATNDPNPAYRSGRWAPPVFGVVPTWAVLRTAVADVVPAGAMAMSVHGEQDMHFHLPLVPGRSLAARAQAHSIRVGRSGTRCTILVRSRDAESGEPVLDQYTTLYVRGLTEGTDGGPDKPGHAFPEQSRGRPVGAASVHVDEDQTLRYRDVSGDDVPIHWDEGVARSVGLPGIIVHGLCTMAMCSQVVLALVAGGDPARLARLAVRFSAHVLPGNDVVTTLYDAGWADEASGRGELSWGEPGWGGPGWDGPGWGGPGRRGPARAYAFEATSAGATVVTHGRAEVLD